MARGDVDMPRPVEVVRAGYDALAAGDVDAAVQYVDRDVRVRPAIPPVEQGPEIHGRAGVKQFFETLLVWRSRRVEFKEVFEAVDRVVIVEAWHFRGSQDIDLDFEITEVYTVRDGLIVRVDGFEDTEEALAAAGMRR